MELRDDPEISVAVLASRTGLAVRSVQRILARLLEEGTISREWQGHSMLTTITDLAPLPTMIPLAGPEALEPVRRALADDLEPEPEFIW